MLNALFYPAGTKQEPIEFDTLFIPYIYKEIYFDGVYNDVFQPQLDNPNNEKIVIDVGANIGVVTQFMRNYSKKVYAIEPSPEHFEALQKNKEFNEWDNVEVFNLAIAEKDGEMKLNRNVNNLTMNSLAVEYIPEVKGQTSVVKTLRFDTFMKENNIDHVDFVKMDVEGYEDHILRSEGFTSIADKIDQIEIEMHFPSWPLLVSHMQGLGFKARRYECSAIVILFYR